MLRFDRVRSSALFISLLSLLVVVLGSVYPITANAVSISDWQAGNIMDDAIFFDKNTMNVGQIQAFLNERLPVCDTWGTKPSEYGGGTRAQYGASMGYPAPFVCLKDYRENPTTKENNLHGRPVPAGSISAAQIIWNVSQEFNISPKALLVTLHKESDRLLIDDWPWESQYRTAMGYGCPDTGPNYSANCNAQYYGFYNQMHHAARQFRRYATYPQEYRYRAGQNNTIQYNPQPSCGSSVVYIENQATAGLYNYTPYQPNQAALAAGYGSAPPCGAYGNRNFWRLYNDWFGPTRLKPIVALGSPAATTWGPNRLDVFVRGSDGGLWQRWYGGGQWRPWARLGDDIGSNPSASSWGANRIDVFSIGSDGNLRQMWYNGKWNGWAGLGKPPGVNLTGSPAVASWGPNRLDVFVRGSDGGLWQRWYGGGQWRPWARLAGDIQSNPSVTTWGPNRLDVFAIGTNGNLRQMWYNGKWNGWADFGQPTSIGSPAATTWGPNRLDVFVRGSDGGLWQRWYGGGQWRPWARLAGGSESNPGAVSWGSNRIDIFNTSGDGHLRQFWYNGKWNGWGQLGRPYR